MTTLEILTDPATGTDAHREDAPLVRWEPCATYAGADAPTCATCGWLADDHELEHGGHATVLTLPTRPTLRRAS